MPTNQDQWLSLNLALPLAPDETWEWPFPGESSFAPPPTTNPQTTVGALTSNNSLTQVSQETTSPLKSNLPYTTLLEDFPSLEEIVMGYAHVGSTYICDPPPVDTDIDNLILLSKKMQAQYKKINELLIKSGWEIDGNYWDLGSNFWSFKKDNLNIIITYEEDFFDTFVRAAKVCKALNITDKELRIMVHDIIINGDSYQVDFDDSF